MRQITSHLITGLCLLLTVPNVVTPQAQPDAWQEEITPRPDPTRLTTTQLLREVAHVRAEIRARLDAMDKAVELIQERVNREPDTVALDIRLVALKDVSEMRFDMMQRQLAERSVMNEKQAISLERNVEAAMASAKELVAQQNIAFTESTRKTEEGTETRLNQLTALFQTDIRAMREQMDTINKSLDAKLFALSDRVGAIEGLTMGQLRERASQDTSQGMLLTIIATLISLAALTVAIILATRRAAA